MGRSAVARAPRSRGVPLAAEVDAWFDHVAGLPDRLALQALGAVRARIEAAEAVVLARAVPDDGDGRRARRLLESCGDSSSADRSRQVGRAQVVAGSAEAAELWSSGQLTGEHIDRLAAADRATGGAASADPVLLGELAQGSANGARKTVNDWLASHRSADDVVERQARQRAGRKAWRHRTDCGLAAITVAGDKPTIDIAWAQIVAGADAAYRADGDRDVPAHQHARSGDQRRFDAACELFAGKGGGSSAGRPVAVVTFEVDPAEAFVQGGAQPRDSAGRSHRPPELVGTGPISNQAALDLLQGCQLWTLLHDPKGQPLWLGRSGKQPSRAQLIALICRDRGCVETGRHWRSCDIHHRNPWSAPVQGPTDVGNLVLLDPPVHRRSHANNRHWEYNPQTGKYFTRHAEFRERAPQRKDVTGGAGDRRPQVLPKGTARE